MDCSLGLAHLTLNLRYRMGGSTDGRGDSGELQRQGAAAPCLPFLPSLTPFLPPHASHPTQTHLVLPLHALYIDLKVQLPHAADDNLSRLVVGRHLQTDRMRVRSGRGQEWDQRSIRVGSGWTESRTEGKVKGGSCFSCLCPLPPPPLPLVPSSSQPLPAHPEGGVLLLKPRQGLHKVAHLLSTLRGKRQRHDRLRHLDTGHCIAVNAVCECV